MIKVGIVGGAGYTGGELIRLLLHHEDVELSWVESQSQAGLPLASTHLDLTPYTNMNFVNNGDINSVDAIFLCTGHGRAQAYIESHSIPESVKVIDLSHDYRIGKKDGFIYGLPELYREYISKSGRVANPGCFATAIQLGLIPLASHGLLQDSIHVTAITGSTGAGQNPSTTTHFSWRNNNISVYKAYNHQHLAEINQSLKALQASHSESRLHFVPMRGPFPRGILASISLKSELSEIDIQDTFSSYYDSHPFVQVVDSEPDLKLVLNTNFSFLSVRKHQDQAHIVVAIDNLIKGASGQAVQNFNLMFDLPETKGLALKPSVY